VVASFGGNSSRKGQTKQKDHGFRWMRKDIPGGVAGGSFRGGGLPVGDVRRFWRLDVADLVMVVRGWAEK